MRKGKQDKDIAFQNIVSFAFKASFTHEADSEGELVGFLNQLTPGELHSCRKTPDFHRHSASGLLHPCGAPEQW